VSALGFDPWSRAYRHAQLALTPGNSRFIHTVAMLVFTSLPVASIYAFYVGSSLLGWTWAALSIAGALGECSQGPIGRLFATYIYGVPPWLSSQGISHIYDPPADGTCFFKAVSKSVRVSEGELRNQIAAWIEKEGMAFLTEEQEENEYTNRIRRADVNLWGGELEARAVAEIFNQQVVIYEEGMGATYDSR
jgi:OTU-like cysteine protease.